MYHLQRNFVVWASLVLASAMSFSTMTQASEIYFSEYAEPVTPTKPFYQRYIEIYNGSDVQINLDDYAVITCKDQCANAVKYNLLIRLDNRTLSTERYIPAGGTYVITPMQGTNRNTAIDDAAAARGFKNNNLVITGNDPLALVKKEDTWSNDTQNWKNQIKHYTVLDVIGTPQTGTSDFTGVCGVSTLANITLVRKEGKQGTNSWATSKGTSASDCHWDVKAGNDFSNVGTHSPGGSGDTIAPVITLTGDQIVEVALNGSYSDAGATASDDTDGTITGSITTVGSTPDTSVPGTYAVTYDVDDAAGNSASQVVRTVIVSPWNFDSVAHGWIAKNGATSATGTGAITVTIPTTKGYGGSATNNYPDFRLNTDANINPKAGKYVAVTMKNKSPNAKLALGAFTGGNAINGNGFATALSSVPVSQTEFKTVYFNMKTANASAKWNMTTGAVVTGLQMRVQFAGGTNGAKAGDIEISKVVVSPTNTDTVAPTLSNISMVSNNSDTSKAKIGDTVTVTFTADEPINPVVTFKSGGAAVQYGVVALTNSDSTKWPVIKTGETWEASYTVNGADTDGAITYSIDYKDTKTGTANVGTTKTGGGVSADASVPTITTSSIVSAVNDGVTALGSVSANETVTWSISGSGVSISSAGVVTLDSAANYQVATSHSFTINATDSIGNVTSTGALSVSVVDATAPTITSGVVSSVNDGDTALGSMSSNEAVTWSITGSGVSISSSGAVTLDSAANAGSATSHSFTVTATDGSGNATTTGTLSVSVVDTTGPIITTSSIVSSVNDGVTALGSMSSNEAVTWSITGSGVSISSSGAVTLDSAANAGSATSHSFTVTATDGSGNATTTGTLSVSVVDTTGPIITTSSIVSSVNDGVTALGSVSANETVTWSISGSGVSISSCRCCYLRFSGELSSCYLSQLYHQRY